MLKLSYLPGEILIQDLPEDKKTVAVLQKWMADLHLQFGPAEKLAQSFRIPILVTGTHPHFEEHLWYALGARDHVWGMLLLHHLTHPADVYEVLEVIAISPPPQSPMQRAFWRSARQLMGMV